MAAAAVVRGPFLRMLMPPLRLLFITNEPEVATFVCAEGADRVFVDLELLGKQERQGHLNTVISRHSLGDVERIRAAVPDGALLVRINPMNAGSEQEIEAVLRRGADTLMLPMFHGRDEVERFCALVDGRARISLLVETVGAMDNLAEIVRVPGIDEVHIGLNDLHLELGCRFMFEPLADGHVDRMARVLREAGLPFGIGGVARVGEGLLPAELLLAEHARLGSTGAILSRTFHRQARSVAEIRQQMDFAAEVSKLRDAFLAHAASSAQLLAACHAEVKAIVSRIAAGLPVRSGIRRDAG